MSATRAINPMAGAAIDPAPLIGARRPSRRPSLSGAARFLRRASSRRMMREPSMLVRETAAEQIEERQSDWAYSRPVVFLDILWNLAFVGVSTGVLIMSKDERPRMPLRIWIVGYALQCVLHMICVCVEYRRRHQQQQAALGLEYGGMSQGSSGPSSPRDLEEGRGGGGDYDSEQGPEDEGSNR